MDLLEYKQTAEAVKYIDNYNPYDKFSEEYINQKLNDFQIKDKIIGPGQGAICKSNNIPLISGNGCTESQMEKFRDILLSAKRNYRQTENNIFAEADKQQIEKDLLNGTYNGKTIDDYENLRLEAIEKIKNSDDFEEKLQIIIKYSREIHNGLKKIAENKLIKEVLAEAEINNAEERMISGKPSPKQVSDYLRNDIIRIYKLYPELIERLQNN